MFDSICTSGKNSEVPLNKQDWKGSSQKGIDAVGMDFVLQEKSRYKIMLYRTHQNTIKELLLHERNQNS